MWPLPLDKPASRLLRKVAKGRYCTAGEYRLLLGFQRWGGDGLILTGRIEQQGFSLWVEESQWCSWVSPVLPVPGWSNVPVSLQSVLAVWTLAPASACLEQINISLPVGETLQAGYIAADMGWVLILEHEERRLVLRCINIPFEWLEKLADALSPLPQESISPDEPLPFPLVAGWSQVSYGELCRLRAGDGLALQEIADVANDELWLYQNRPLVKVQVQADGIGKVGAAMNKNFDDWLDIAPTSIDNINDVQVTVVAEVGFIELPLSMLGQLHPGQTLEAPNYYDGRVKLTVSGRVIASGVLLEIEGHLAVRVDRLGG